MNHTSNFSTTVSKIMSTYALVIFVILWGGFAVALALDREWLDLAWDWLRDLPPVAEIISWLLFLPITVGLWIWESSWSTLLRLVGLAGLIGWTILAVSSFFRYRQSA